MKKNLLPFLAFTLFFVMLFPHVKGQTYPNFALGEGSTQSSSAVVRNVDSQSVIASYKDAGGIYRLVRVDLASIVSAKLESERQHDYYNYLFIHNISIFKHIHHRDISTL